jgi:hypothetical protein
MPIESSTGLSPSLASLLSLSRTLGGVIVGGAIAYGYAVAFVPKLWEASVLVQIGQIGEALPSPQMSIRAPRPIEPPARVVERIGLASFEGAVLVRLGLPNDYEDPRSELLRDSLRARLLERANLVSIAVRAQSPEEAARSLEAVIAELAGIHARLGAHSVERLKGALSEARAALQAAEAERDAARTQFSRAIARSTTHFSEGVLAAEVLSTRDDQVRRATDNVRALEVQLGPEFTFPTSAYETTYVPERPIHPRKLLYALAGAVFGGAFALVLGMLLRDARLRHAGGSQ